MAHEFIYTCYKLARHYPPDRTVLENISLSFYPVQKSALSDRMVQVNQSVENHEGLDDGYSGEARLAWVHRWLPRSGTRT